MFIRNHESSNYWFEFRFPSSISILLRESNIYLKPIETLVVTNKHFIYVRYIYTVKWGRNEILLINFFYIQWCTVVTLHNRAGAESFLHNRFVHNRAGAESFLHNRFVHNRAGAESFLQNRFVHNRAGAESFL